MDRTTDRMDMALKTVIEEEFADTFSCFICMDFSSGENYQLTCCSKYMCAGCHNDNIKLNEATNCPHCRSRQVGYQKISNLKYVLDGIRDNLVSNVISNMEENNSKAVQAANQTRETNLRTTVLNYFARGFPLETKTKKNDNPKARENATKVTQDDPNCQTARIPQNSQKQQSSTSVNPEPTAPTKRKTQETPTISFLETRQSLEKRSKNLRPIIIDGMNVAIEYGNSTSQHKTFDCLGLLKAYEYFQSKNHEVYIILPPRAQINENTEIQKKNFDILDEIMEKDKDSIIYATQRRLGVNGPWIKQHDEYLLFDIEKEIMPGGIIVSRDDFSDHWYDAVRTGDDYGLKQGRFCLHAMHAMHAIEFEIFFRWFLISDSR